MPRAHGRIIDGLGNPVVGCKVFPYLVRNLSNRQWQTLVDKDGRPVAPPTWAHQAVAVVDDQGTPKYAETTRDPDRRGYFDFLGGLPNGLYVLDVVAPDGGKVWAWPFRVTDAGEPMDVRLGGPGASVPSRDVVVAVFGDSDTSERGPIGARTTDVAKELEAPGRVVRNWAQGNLPVGTQTEPDGGGEKRSGLDVVRQACAEMPILDVGVCRYGLNDAHYYLSPPTPAGIAKFRDAYGKVISALQAKGAKVILVTIVLEGGNRDRDADRAINDALRDLARERGCDLVDPALDAENDPQDRVWTDGIHINDRGTAYVADLISPKIGFVAPPAPKPSPVALHFLPGTYTASVSLYGLLGAPMDRIKRDLSRFREAGFGNARVWVTWGSLDKYRQPASAAFDKDGNFVEPVARKLDEILAFCATIGMSLDLTMHSSHFRTERVSDEGYDIQWHKAAVRRALERWGNAPAFRILDMANEAEVRGPSPGSGSPAAGHVSPGRFLELMQVARSVPHRCLVSCSVSGGGDFPGDVPKNYVALFRSTKGEILLPHFARKAGWGAKEDDNARALAAKIPGIPIHHQEPARNNYNGQNWPVSEFEASFRSAKAAGSVGCCFHTGAGFDVRTRDAWDQLDAVERQVVASLKGWLS